MRPRFLDAVSTKFYDPLYDVVVFSSRESSEGERAFWTSGQRNENAVTAEHFLRILETYEFGRLNFLRQAGLAWLVFPSATHTRFSHSLGCWLLSDWAADNVFVYQSTPDGTSTHGEGVGRRPLVRLGPRLREIGWLEEFQIALLLHDLGHFPFSHVIENNDLLNERFQNQAETAGIRLKHESIGCRLIEGNNRVASLFREFMKNKVGSFDRHSFISDVLAVLPKLNIHRLIYLMDEGSDASCDTEIPTLPADLRFIKAVRELVSGVIDLDRLDHYHRDAHFISLRVGEFNVHGLLHHLALVDFMENQDGEPAGEPRMEIQLVGDGVGHAFQMLYAKMTLTQTVFHNPSNLAFEVMLNMAINRHWDTAGRDFRVFLPFMDDGELIQHLVNSNDPLTRQLVHRIKHRRPFAFAGKFILPVEEYKKLGSTKAERRSQFKSLFNEAAHTRVLNATREECFLRMDKAFGNSELDSEWMDLGRILGDDGSPLATLEDHGKFVDFVREHESVSARTFWIFVADDALRDKAAALGATLAGGIHKPHRPGPREVPADPHRGEATIIAPMPIQP